MAGVALLFVQEMRASRGADRRGAARARPSLLVAVLAASVANVMQLMPAVEGAPDRRHARLGDALRRARRRASSPGPVAGPPVVEARLGYWLGLALSRPDRLGARLLALFRDHPRDRPGQGGLFERADPDHRHGDLDRRSRAIAGRRSPSPAACSPLAGLVIALRAGAAAPAPAPLERLDVAERVLHAPRSCVGAARARGNCVRLEIEVELDYHFREGDRRAAGDRGRAAARPAC